MIGGSLMRRPHIWDCQSWYSAWPWPQLQLLAVFWCRKCLKANKNTINHWAVKASIARRQLRWASTTHLVVSRFHNYFVRDHYGVLHVRLIDERALILWHNCIIVFVSIWIMSLGTRLNKVVCSTRLESWYTQAYIQLFVWRHAMPAKPPANMPSNQQTAGNSPVY